MLRACGYGDVGGEGEREKEPATLKSRTSAHLLGEEGTQSTLTAKHISSFLFAGIKVAYRIVCLGLCFQRRKTLSWLGGMAGKLQTRQPEQEAASGLTDTPPA